MENLEDEIDFEKFKQDFFKSLTKLKDMQHTLSLIQLE